MNSAREPLRVLITGFRPFPGAPFNPTQALVRSLARLRRPALADVELRGHVFAVTYAAVDHELPDLVAQYRPDALLMFGLAARMPYLRVETRARNTVTALWPDSDHTHVCRINIEPRGPAALTFGPVATRLFHAVKETGVDTRLSRDAGRYLCNYLSWRAIKATRQAGGPRLAAFIHVPSLPRFRAPLHRRTRAPVSAADLVRAGTAALLTVVALAKRG